MKLRTNKNQVVCCTSLEEVEQCFKIFKEFDTSASNDIYDLMMLGWKKYGNRVYFRLEDGELFYGDLKHPLYDSFQILTAQDFLTMHSEPFMGYFESDGTKETGRKIIAVLEALGGVNSHSCNGRNRTKKQYFIAPNNDIDLEYLYSVDGYNKCNLDHYLHLIDHSGDATEIVEKPNELAELRKQLAESVERERIVNNIIAEKDKEIEDNKNSINELDAMCTALNKALDEAKVKADKWDAIPQYLCMRGDKDRHNAIKAIFESKGCENYSGSYFRDEELLYVLPNGGSKISIIHSLGLQSLFLATQTIAELPPLEEKEDIEEFWLKPTDAYVWRFNYTTSHNEWRVFLFDGIIDKNIETLPFTPETEKLIGTNDEPNKKYKFMGIKPYFNQE